MKRPPKGSRLLGTGCSKRAYLLPTGDRVLKVDDYEGSDGCEKEVRFYQHVQESSPHLLKHLATIHDHGPGWLTQDYIPVTFSDDDCHEYHHISEPCDCFDSRMRKIGKMFKAAGCTLRDIHGDNYGRKTPTGWPKIFDLDYCET